MHTIVTVYSLRDLVMVWVFCSRCRREEEHRSVDVVLGYARREREVVVVVAVTTFRKANRGSGWRMEASSRDKKIEPEAWRCCRLATDN